MSWTRVGLMSLIGIAVPCLAHAQMDMFPVADCVIYASPDIRQWPATVTITSVTLGAGHDDGGLSFETVGRDRWPNYEPPGWAGGGEGLQYTVWGARRINGLWHCAGVIQMWRSRRWTGAPFPDEYASWFYDANRWGPLAAFPLRAGEQFCTFLTAGNARKGSALPEPDVTSVAERSNSVCWVVPPVSQGTLTFGTAPPPPPTPLPPAVTPPAPPSQADAAFREWAIHFERWARDFAQWSKVTHEQQSDQLSYIKEHQELIYRDTVQRFELLQQQQARGPDQPVKVDQNNVRSWVSLIAAIVAAVGGSVVVAR